MDPEEDELAALGFVDEDEAVESAPEEADLPGYHQARSRRVVQVDPVHITGTPDGLGSIRTRGGSHVDEDAELEGLFEKDAPAAPPSEREYRDAVRAREDAEDGPDAPGLFSDLVSTLAPVYDTDAERREGVRRRMTRRLGRTAEEVQDDPMALLLGAGEGATMGWLDELGGLAMSHPSGVSRTTGRPYDAVDYETVRDDIRASQDTHRADSPYATGAGELGGAIATAPLLTEEAAATGLGRVAQAVRSGAEFGGLAAAGASEGSGDELLADTGEGMLLGGGAGLVLGGGAEGVRGLGRAASTARTAADRARVAAVGGGSGAPIGDRVMREFEAMPGGTTGQAARIRRLGIVGPASTSRDILQRADAAVEATGNDGVLGRVIAAIEESGERIPVRRLVEQFEAVARRMETNPELAPYAATVRRRGQQWAQTFGGVVEGEAGPMSDLSATVEPRRVREALGTMRDQTQWLDPAGAAVRPPVEASRDLHRSLSRSRDSWVDDVLGDGAGADYREARLDLGTAMQAQEAAEQAAQRAARARGISLTDYLAAQAGASSGQGGVTQALGSMLLNRAWRGREGAFRATATEAIARILEAGGGSRFLGQYGPMLERALERGGPALLAAYHEQLTATDPAYAERIAELEAAGTADEELPEGFTYEDAAAPQ